MTKLITTELSAIVPVDPDAAQSILKFVTQYWIHEASESLSLDTDNESILNQIINNIINSYSDAQPALGKSGLGIKQAELSGFKNQLALWQKGSIDWESSSQLNRFLLYENLIFTEIREVFVDADPTSLPKTLLTLRDSLDYDTLGLIDNLTGLILGLSKKYSSKKLVKLIRDRIKYLYPDTAQLLATGAAGGETLLYGQDYELPNGYGDLQTAIQNILTKHPKLTKVEGYELTLDGKGLQGLNAENASDYSQYQVLTKRLKLEAYRCLMANLAMNEGEPFKVSNLHRNMLSDGIYIPPDLMPSANFNGFAQEITLDSGAKGVAYLSKFGEPLNKSIRGFVTNNDSYEQHSTSRVCTYIDPVSVGLSVNYVYTQKAETTKKTQRYGGTLGIISDLDTYRNSWMKDVKALSSAIISSKGSKQAIRPMIIRRGVLGLLCELGYQVAPRTGEKGNSTILQGKSVATFAITTVRLRHVVTAPAKYNPAVNATQEKPDTIAKYLSSVKKIIISYPGKDAQPQSHELSLSTLPNNDEGRKLWTALVGYLALLGLQFKSHPDNYNLVDSTELQREQLFKVPNGNATSQTLWVDVHNRMLNAYIKQQVKFPEGQTFKAFRKLKATKAFADYMDSVKSELSSSNIDKFVRQGAAVAGKQLGHAAARRGTPTGDLALSYYILPSVVESYYLLVDATPTGKIAKSLKSGTEND